MFQLLHLGRNINLVCILLAKQKTFYMNMTREQAQKNIQDLINVGLSNGYFKDVPSVVLMQNSLNILAYVPTTTEVTKEPTKEIQQQS